MHVLQCSRGPFLEVGGALAAHRSCTRCRLPRCRLRAVAHATSRAQDVQIEQQQTYLGETFWQVWPAQDSGNKRDRSRQAVPEVKLSSLNHASLEAPDVAALAEFYVKVLNFRRLDRPNFPFGGAWLQGGDLTLHIIEEDPSVPKHTHHWQDKFKQEPQTWYIRRANHLAFEVDNAEAMEHRLQHFGIEYTRAIVPGTEAVQLFFYDLHGNGVEVGSNYGEVAEMLNRKKTTAASAVSP